MRALVASLLPVGRALLAQPAVVAALAGWRRLTRGDDVGQVLGRGVGARPCRPPAPATAHRDLTFLALRLARSTRLSLAASAATGAFLLLVADLLAQHALSFQLPVGTVTVCLGGSYLIWLLIREARSRS